MLRLYTDLLYRAAISSLPADCRSPRTEVFAVSSIRHTGGSMLKGFRQFILRGNVLDLAVAVVIGAAFGAVVTSFVTNILTPLIAAIVGKPDFSAFYFSVNGAVLSYGVFLNALVAFLLVAAAVYVFMT